MEAFLIFTSGTRQTGGEKKGVRGTLPGMNTRLLTVGDGRKMVCAVNEVRQEGYNGPERWGLLLSLNT